MLEYLEAIVTLCLGFIIVFDSLSEFEFTHLSAAVHLIAIPGLLFLPFFRFTGRMGETVDIWWKYFVQDQFVWLIIGAVIGLIHYYYEFKDV